MDIPKIVKQHVLKTQGRMPETDDEVNEYLDLINHAKEYANKLFMAKVLGKAGMKRLGLRINNQSNQ